MTHPSPGEGQQLLDMELRPWVAMVPTRWMLVLWLAEQRRMLHEEQAGRREILGEVSGFQLILRPSHFLILRFGWPTFLS